MEDNLIACSKKMELQSLHEDIMTNQLAAGLQIAMEKIQILLSYEYLGYFV